jgi:hypothetical protein
MALTDADRTFLRDHHGAAMITVGADGMPKAVRIGVALVDDRLWSSGTIARARTRRLRRDPRCTLFVFDEGFAYRSFETTVTIREGADVPALSIQLFRVMQGRDEGRLSWFGSELDEDAFAKAMVDEGRLIYEFEVHRSSGLS